MADGKRPIGGTDFIRAHPPHGFGMQYYTHDDGTVSGQITIDRSKQGPPGHVHGGALIAVLDEAMGAAAWVNGHRVVAANLQFDLRRGVPLDVNVTFTGQVERKEGRKVYCSGQVILPDGTVAVEARGLFIEAPNYVGGADGFNPFEIATSD